LHRQEKRKRALLESNPSGIYLTSDENVKIERVFRLKALLIFLELHDA
jgi:hypothetical protein